jgi:hypothetical protein
MKYLDRLNEWVKNYIKRITPYSPLIVAVLVVLLMLLFLYEELDNYSYKSEIDAEKFYYFFSILGALATFLLLFVAYQQLIEMKKQFHLANGAELYFNDTTWSLPSENGIKKMIEIQNITEPGQNAAVWSERIKIKVENIGLGHLKKLQIRWIGEERENTKNAFLILGDFPLVSSIPIIKNYTSKEIDAPYKLLSSYIFSSEILKELDNKSEETFELGRAKAIPIENDIKLQVKYSDVFNSDIKKNTFKLDLGWRIEYIKEVKYFLDLKLIEEI